MEYFGFVAFIFMAMYAAYPGKIKKIEREIKNIKRKLKGENSMSKILSELINKNCKVICEDGIVIGLTDKVECTILDVDDEWIKLCFVDKKVGEKTHILRVDSIKRVDLID
ncbi:Uncharacterised protein [uncultured Clostridium sp.]|uniref:hypothetical protein n=1 Tax=uncultured Clostridium sp. TaxID=59620 RepID=UPI0008234C33|nr:hypothetical protein [uncultured Clostridium sp.]SCK03204.1 Uncharacterised protein [uncultured Clostridium sp.]